MPTTLRALTFPMGCFYRPRAVQVVGIKIREAWGEDGATGATDVAPTES